MTVSDARPTTTAIPDQPGLGIAAEPSVAERLFASALGAMDIFSVYLGERLGWYAALHEQGPMTADELASATGTSPRYAREWLEQQAVTGLLVVHSQGTDHAAAASTRRFALPDETADALLDEHSLGYLAPLPRFFMAVAAKMPELLDAYRAGSGVGWGEYGADAREGQAALNRPWFESQLADAIRGVPDLHLVLAQPGIRIADIGCGGGWSTLALAQAYPDASLHGYDIDPPTIDMARENVRGSGLDGRVAFTVADASDLPAEHFDVVFAFECVHDLPHPVEVLAAARRALRPGGCVVVMDEAVAEDFGAPGDEMERMMYGFSLLVCLPDGMAHPDSEGTGTVMRHSTLATYARRAGFETCEVLPIEEFGFWRFYRLR